MRPLLRTAPAIAAATGAAVVLVDWLFWEQPAGWTVGIALASALALVLARHPAALTSAAGTWMSVLALAMAWSCVWEPSALALILAFGAVLGVVMAGRGAWAGEGAATRRWFAHASTAWRRILAAPWRDLRLVGLKRSGSRVLRGAAPWIVPLLLVGVFLWLFQSANPLIERWVGATTAWLGALFDDLPDGQRLLLWLGTGIAVWGLIRLRWSRSGPLRRQSIVEGPTLGDGLQWLLERAGDPAFAVRCLLLFNALFLLQNGLDLCYLWAGSALPSGLTYASYAHRGAYPLVATALLAGLFTLTVFRAGGTAEVSPWARRLVFLWLLQNLVLLGGSLWRLNLYVACYDLTLLRLAAGIWMGLVGGGLALVAWRLWRRLPNDWLLDANALLLVVVLTLVAWCDCRGLVAWYNVRHCQQLDGGGAPLDLAYLEELGLPARPALLWLVQQPVGVETRTAARELAQRLASRHASGWRGWTVRGAAQAAGELP